MTNLKKQLPRAVLDVLNETGLPWEIETGARHNHVRLAGRLAAILPKGRGDEWGRGLWNTVAQIKRVARELKNAGS